MSTINNDKNRFLLILARLKEVSGKSKDKEVAEILGFDKDTFGARKSRGSVPDKEIKIACAERGWNVAYIETGTGPMFTDDTPRPAPEPVAPEPPPGLTPEQQMLLKATEGLDFADMVKLANDALALKAPGRLNPAPAPRVVNG